MDEDRTKIAGALADAARELLAVERGGGDLTEPVAALRSVLGDWDALYTAPPSPGIRKLMDIQRQAMRDAGQLPPED